MTEIEKLALNIIKTQEFVYDNKKTLDEEKYWEILNNLRVLLEGVFRNEIEENSAKELNILFEKSINTGNILIF